jgi:SAM-dependent methyltransferase
MAEQQTQLELWNGEAGARWTAHQDALDRVFAPIDEAGLRRAAPTAGEAVLEVGCGCGASTLALARVVGPSGSVLGLDISRPMLQRARERTAGMSNVTLRQGDAGSYTFPGQVSLIYSRFGVMFFDQPAQAFAHLRGTLGLGGRLCFVCWRSLEANPWQMVPLRAVAPLVNLPPPSAPGQPGPYSLASEQRIHTLLASAGFEDVQIQPEDVRVRLSDAGIAAAVDFVTQSVGPVSRVLDGSDARTRAAVVAAVHAALVPYARGDEVALDAGVWVVHAR